MSAHLHGIGMTSQRTRERLVQRLQAAGIRERAVLEVMRLTPRHLFVDEALASRAYDDTALPIGFGQTISQPYVVARMTEALLAGGGPLQRVLEIGTGCGYQLAVLSQVAGQAYGVERIEALAQTARARLQALGYRNIRVRHGDGFRGLPEYGPYDAILTAAAPEEVPPALIDQLAVGGRLVMPVGTSVDQQLLRLTRTPLGVQQEVLERVSFVPMLAGEG